MPAFLHSLYSVYRAYLMTNIFIQTRHTESVTEKTILNICMFRFLMDHACYCVPMTFSKRDGQKRPMNGYSWAKYSDEQYRAELDRAQSLVNQKLRQKELATIKRKHLGVKALQKFNNTLSLINTAIHSNDSYLIDSIKDDYALLLDNVSATSILVENSFIVFDCDTEDHNSVNGQNGSIDCPSLLRLKEWCDSHNLSFNMFQNTFTVRTTSGGYHFYFYYAGDAIKRKIGLVEKVDLIAGHSLIMSPYSAKSFISNGVDNSQVIRYLPVQLQLKNNQIEYSYLQKLPQVKPLPSDLEKILIREQTSSKTVANTSVEVINTYMNIPMTQNRKRIGQKILMNNLHDFGCTGEGLRHDSLLKHVRNVFMFYSYLRDYGQEEILTMFKERALTLGLSSGEIDTPMRDAMKFGLQHQKLLA